MPDDASAATRLGPIAPPTTGREFGDHTPPKPEHNSPRTVTTATALPGTRSRIDFLDGIRALAAVFVVVHHIWLSSFPTYPSISGPWWAGWMIYGHFAVSVFIVVSGFSLSIAPARHDWQLSDGPVHFMYRRAWRIVPAYWAALVFSCAVVVIFTGAAIAKTFVVHAVLLQDLVANDPPNGAFWSIAVEWHIYFFFPLFLLIRRRRGPLWLLAFVSTAVVIGYLLATNVAGLHKFVTISPQFAVLFVMGMVAATLVNRGYSRSTMWISWGAGLLTVGFIALCLLAGSEWVVQQFFWTDLLAGAAAAAFVAALTAGHPALLRKALASRPLAGTGAFSYSIYLIHAPIVWIIWHYGFSRIDAPQTTVFVLSLAVTMPAVILVSWLFYLVFEKPFLTRRSWAAWRQWARARVGRAALGPNPAEAPSS